jgi:hypothetical protein
MYYRIYRYYTGTGCMELPLHVLFYLFNSTNIEVATCPTVNHIIVLPVLLHQPNSETDGEVICMQMLCFSCFPFQKNAKKKKDFQIHYDYITMYTGAHNKLTVYGIHTSIFNSWENSVHKFTD